MAFEIVHHVFDFRHGPCPVETKSLGGLKGVVVNDREGDEEGLTRGVKDMRDGGK